MSAQLQAAASRLIFLDLSAAIFVGFQCSEHQSAAYAHAGTRLNQTFHASHNIGRLIFAKTSAGAKSAWLC